MDGNGPVETICATVEDYSNDFSLLQQDYLFYLLIELERLVTVEYIKPRLYRNSRFFMDLSTKIRPTRTLYFISSKETSYYTTL